MENEQEIAKPNQKQIYWMEKYKKLKDEAKAN